MVKQEHSKDLRHSQEQLVDIQYQLLYQHLHQLQDLARHSLLELVQHLQW